MVLSLNLLLVCHFLKFKDSEAAIMCSLRLAAVSQTNTTCCPTAQWLWLLQQLDMRADLSSALIMLSDMSASADVLSGSEVCLCVFLKSRSQWRKHTVYTHTNTHCWTDTPLSSFHPWPQFFWPSMLEWSLLKTKAKMKSLCVRDTHTHAHTHKEKERNRAGFTWCECDICIMLMNLTVTQNSKQQNWANTS